MRPRREGAGEAAPGPLAGRARRTALALFAALVAALVASCATGRPPVPFGERPPSAARFAGQAVGPTVGKTEVVVFFATWSAASRALLPELQALADRSSARIAVWGVAIDQDQRFVAPFLAQAGVGFPVVLDPGGRVSVKEFGLASVPSVLVADPSGATRAVFAGPARADAAAIARAAETAAGNRGAVPTGGSSTRDPTPSARGSSRDLGDPASPRNP